MFNHSLPKKAGAILMMGLIMSGCTHRYEIKNLSEYRPTSINPLNKRISIGIVSSEEDPSLKRLVQEIGTELEKYAGQVILPYQSTSQKKVDVIADVRITPEYKGSGANFWINWPGFLVWAPAWHGYVYKVKYIVDVTLIDSAKNEKMDFFSIPISLDIRHAAINRTWTELSWLEVSAIALVGGGVFTGYDPKITPLTAENAGQVIGAYVGNEVVAHINGSGRFTRLFDHTLNQSEEAAG